MKNYLSTSNSKLKATGKEFGTKIASFDIPDHKTREGKLICIGADKCKEFCYAGKGFYKSYPSVSEGQHTRLELTEDIPLFIKTITKELNAGRKTIKYVRIHSAGDFYSKKYLMAWIEIAKLNPHVRFYCYTKSVPLFITKEGEYRFEIPDNFDVTFSFGGKFDHYINKSVHKHTEIFEDKNSLELAGYNDASKHDLEATKFHTDSLKIGLIFH